MYAPLGRKYEDQSVLTFPPEMVLTLHQPRARLRPTMSHMLQRIELIIIYYTFHSSRQGHSNEYSILTRRGSNCSACGGIAAEGTSSDTKNEMTLIGYFFLLFPGPSTKKVPE